jgi:hypothetical protein
MKEWKLAHRLMPGAVIVSALMLGASTSGHADEKGAQAAAQPPKPVVAADPAQHLESVIHDQARRLDDQDRRLSEQQKTIDALKQQLDALQAERESKAQPAQANSESDLDAIRAAGLPPKPNPVAAPSVPAVQPIIASPAVQADVPIPIPRPAATTAAPIAVAQGNAPANQMPAAQMPAQMPAGMGGAATPMGPVGEAPPMSNEPPPEVMALPEGARVLTATGRLVGEYAMDYGRTASNRLIFRGIEILPGFQVGLIDANETANDTADAALNVRYGIFDRAELSARLPFVYRHDRVTTLVEQTSTTQTIATQTTILDGKGIGDLEVSGRYQLNRGLTPTNPIFVGGLTLKTITGTGPFDVKYDSQGVALELPTGSGFWALSPSVTMLFPSDPVVLFASLGYSHSFWRDINKTFGTTTVGKVTPGDAFSISMGFGFALNPQFSFSLGFADTYILASSTELASTGQTLPAVLKSTDAEAASLTMGWSYVFSPTFTLSTSFNFGVTSDAGDFGVTVRLPLTF